MIESEVKEVKKMKRTPFLLFVILFPFCLFVVDVNAQDKKEQERSDEKAESVKKKLKDIEVAVLYENITDPVRGTDEMVKILKETGTEFVFRAFWRWGPCPNKVEDIPSRTVRRRYSLRGYYYENLEKVIKKLKQELPNLLICGAVPAQILARQAVFNPLTGEVIRYPKTWKMALDPSRWGLKMSKKEFQTRFGKTHFWVDKDAEPEDYDPEKVPAYFPDITNPDFQELLLAWAKRQIDAGADCIWIDMLFAQAKFLYRLSGDFDHKSVKETWRALCKVVDELHAYGKKHDKPVYVGSWGSAIYFPHKPPKLDFITVSPSSREVRTLKLNAPKWDERLKKIREKFNDIPVFAFIDWAGSTKTPLGQFSQVLSKEQQCRFIEMADEFFTKRGVMFVYPVHGGWMGNDAKILSFGRSRVYDSLAPEFNTYPTIKQLAEKKRKEEKP